MLCIRCDCSSYIIGLWTIELILFTDYYNCLLLVSCDCIKYLKVWNSLSKCVMMLIFSSGIACSEQALYDITGWWQSESESISIQRNWYKTKVCLYIITVSESCMSTHVNNLEFPSQQSINILLHLNQNVCNYIV